VVAAPARAARLAFDDLEAIAREPLLGDHDKWERFLAQGGCRMRSRPVAEFNDAGLMLQATEQDLGIALARELFVADALASGRLVRLASAALDESGTHSTNTFWFVHPPELADWPPLLALKHWLHDEMEASRQQLASLAPSPAVPAAEAASARPAAQRVAPAGAARAPARQRG
jgi:DNA-binding transcriptional LysR family regulator